MKNYQISIFGDVTRKGFRFSAMQKAYKLNIRGLIQNQKKGMVIIEAEGEENKLIEFLDWCKVGPMWARVENLTWEEAEVKGYESFDIIHSKYQKVKTEVLSEQPKGLKSLLKNLHKLLDDDENTGNKRVS